MCNFRRQVQSKRLREGSGPGPSPGALGRGRKKYFLGWGAAFGGPKPLGKLERRACVSFARPGCRRDRPELCWKWEPTPAGASRLSVVLAGT